MKKLFYCLPIVWLLLSCTHVVKTAQNDGYEREVYKPAYATGFVIRSQTNDTTMLQLEIYRPDTMRIAIPRGGFGRVLCMSSTYVGMLDAVGTSDRIVAVSGKEYLTNEKVRQHAVEAGFDGAMDYETILAAKPEIALIYGISGANPIAAKLEEISIPHVYINDFEEQDPLGRAEWMVALGALTGTDGRTTFSNIAKQYNNRYKKGTGQTKVMINAPYGGNWFIPGRGNYMSRLIADAGGQICVEQADGEESQAIDIEQALPALSTADVWLNPGQADSRTDLHRLVPKARFDGAVWNQNPDFYESGAARPDLVRHELEMIFSGLGADTLHYFRKVE